MVKLKKLGELAGGVNLGLGHESRTADKDQP